MVRRKKHVTMQTIADQVGVSKVTVSKALNNKEGVSDELKKQIKDLADSLGYVINQGDDAQVQPKNIAIFVQEKFVEARDYIPFYLKFYQRLTKTLNSKGYMCNLFTITSTTQRDNQLPLLFSSDHINGVIIMGPIKKTYIQEIKKLGIPIIFLDHYDSGMDADCVVTDNYYSTYELTNYLVRNGHQAIGFVGNINATSSIQDRYMGYHRSLLEANITYQPEWVIDDRDENGEEISFNLPKDMPTAFVCNCDDTAYKFVNFLNEKGYKVPEDISIVGFDNDIYAELCKPGLTTVAVDIKTMVEKAVSMMLKNIEATSEEKARKLFITGDIIYRHSVKNINKK